MRPEAASARVPPGTVAYQDGLVTDEPWNAKAQLLRSYHADPATTLDLAVLESLVAAAPPPVSAMAGPGAPSVAELSRVGVRRVSIGTGIAEAAYAVTRRAAPSCSLRGRTGHCRRRSTTPS